jgi:ferredoxin-NADP reductase
VFDYEVSVLIGGGIGVTPFASILKTIWYRLSQPKGLKKLKKVYLIWTCRDTKSFEWFQDLLKTLEQDVQSGGAKFHDFLSINMFLTSKLTLDNAHNIFMQEGCKENRVDAITGLNARTRYGRPNFEEVFKGLRQSHHATDVGVFYCGPVVLGNTVQKACNQWTESFRGGTRFYYGSEKF